MDLLRDILVWAVAFTSTAIILTLCLAILGALVDLWYTGSVGLYKWIKKEYKEWKNQQ